MTSGKPCFALELRLRIDSAGRRQLARDFEFARELSNATLGTVLKRREAMRQTPEWKAAGPMPKGKERNRIFRDLVKRFGIASANDFEKILLKHSKDSGRGRQLHSNIKQVVADNLWKAFAEWTFNGWGRPRFKSKSRGIRSLRAKSNATGIIWKPDRKTVMYGGREYGVCIDPRDDYVRESLRDPKEPSKWRKARYCIIVRRMIRGKEQYFVQIILDGMPPVKIIPAPLEAKAAIDPGMEYETVAFENGEILKIRISPEANMKQSEVRRIERKMDRSRRTMNPANYCSNGTTKKGCKEWKFSKAYRLLRDELADSKRRKTASRKCVHGRFLNLLLQQAGEIRIEKNCWIAMQRSRYRKSVVRGAPSEFFKRLMCKAERAGQKAFEMSPWNIKPTQRDLVTGECRKREIWERRVQLGDSDLFIDRDAAAAVNLLFHAPETGVRNARGIEKFLQASKQYWLDAGIAVQIKDAKRMPEKELRRVLRNGMPASSVERLHPQTFLNGKREPGSGTAAIGCPGQTRSRPFSETGRL